MKLCDVLFTVGAFIVIMFGVDLMAAAFFMLD